MTSREKAILVTLVCLRGCRGRRIPSEPVPDVRRHGGAIETGIDPEGAGIEPEIFPLQAEEYVFRRVKPAAEAEVESEVRGTVRRPIRWAVVRGGKIVLH